MGVANNPTSGGGKRGKGPPVKHSARSILGATEIHLQHNHQIITTTFHELDEGNCRFELKGYQGEDVIFKTFCQKEIGTVKLKRAAQFKCQGMRHTSTAELLFLS